MDEIVKQALAKWPNVPHCTGWMLLDRRGAWRMRDEATQAAGLPGSQIRHAALLAFIARNYERDEQGQWFFQNGPQRVYVELGYTPWVVRLAFDDTHSNLTLTDQIGGTFEPAEAWLDDQGNVLFSEAGTPPRVAVLHDHDLDLLADHADFESAPAILRWNNGRILPVQPIRRDEVAGHFGFVPSPALRAAEHP
jgi:hypothetical protein